MNKPTIEEILTPKPEARPRIYAYAISDTAHDGLLKVGQTTRNVKQRIGEQLKTAAITNFVIELDEDATRDDGSIITDSSLRHSVLGIRSYIGEGTSLEDAIVMGADYYESPEQLAANEAMGRPHLGVGRNCRIRHAIVDKNARIGDGCVLSPEGKEDGEYLEGRAIIRDGVLVVPKGAEIAPGTIL